MVYPRASWAKAGMRVRITLIPGSQESMERACCAVTLVPTRSRWPAAIALTYWSGSSETAPPGFAPANETRKRASPTPASTAARARALRSARGPRVPRSLGWCTGGSLSEGPPLDLKDIDLACRAYLSHYLIGIIYSIGVDAAF